MYKGANCWAAGCIRGNQTNLLLTVECSSHELLNNIRPTCLSCRPHSRRLRQPEHPPPTSRKILENGIGNMLNYFSKPIRRNMASKMMTLSLSTRTKFADVISRSLLRKSFPVTPPTTFPGVRLPRLLSWSLSWSSHHSVSLHLAQYNVWC